MLAGLPFLAIRIATTVYAAPKPIEYRDGINSLRIRQPEAFRSAAFDVTTTNYHSLSRRTTTGDTSISAQTFLLHSRNDNHVAQLTHANGDTILTTQITIGQTAKEVVIDTGSSDLWVVQSDFQCVDGEGKIKEQARCRFGKPFNDVPSGGMIENQNFNVTYKDSEFLIGSMWYDQVTIAGLTVKHQEVDPLSLSQKTSLTNVSSLSSPVQIGVVMEYPAVSSD
nr:Eukaryotic aspartyl protease [uncultured organism]